MRCVADPGQLKSKLPTAWDRGAEFVIPPLEPHRAHPFQPTPVASRSWLHPGSATARRGTASTVRLAVPRGQRVPQPRATSREKLPAPSASRRASGNKSDKAVADFVFVPARQMVPEKLRALYVTGERRQCCVPRFGPRTRMVRVTSVAKILNAAPLPRR